MQTENVGTFSLDDNVWQGVTLTDSAAKQVKTLVTQDPDVKGLQLSVKQSGCAGFAYVLDLTNPTESNAFHRWHRGRLCPGRAESDLQI
jgi:Fe-S cluster assembly protein SufA